MSCMCLQVRIMLEDVMEAARRPTYRSLEVGFRHHPLSEREKLQRLEETCAEIAADLDYVLHYRCEHKTQAA